jgi:P-type Mg2+ transporter
LNLLLLSLATASYFLGDQRAAIVIAIMVILSISLSFIQEHRSNNAADKLQRMVSITATVRRQTGAEAHDHIDVPIEQLVPGDIVLLSAGDMIPADLRLITRRISSSTSRHSPARRCRLRRSLPPMSVPQRLRCRLYS